MALTDREVATAKPAAQRIEIPDNKVPGFALRVTPAGVKTWTIRYRVGGGRRGRMRRLTLGAYPRLGLQKARQEAQKALRAVDGGADPASDKLAARQGETVGDLARDFLAKYAKKHKKSWADDDRYLNAEVLPAWKHRKVKELTRRDVRALIEGIAERGAPISANRCLALVRKMLNWAVSQDWIDANPAALLPRPGVEHSRERVLSDAEIRLVWRAFEAERPTMCGLMKLRLLTAQRGGELLQLRWTDIDGDWLTIPGSVAKNKTAHRVPLTRAAVDLLNGLPRVKDCPFVFPGRTERKPLGDAKKAGRRVAARVLEQLRETDPTIGEFDFRGHDLRRTAATRMAAAGVSQADIARVLNHVEGGPRATQVYNRYQGDAEKRIALDTWARVLAKLIANRQARRR